MTNKTYIHEDNEWVLTGRVAHKKGVKVDRGISVPHEETLVEIRLLNTEAGNPNWTKWVKTEELFEIVIENDIDLKAINNK